jgi:glucose dehydrogenase
VLECGKAGWCFVVDRPNGKLLFRTDEFVPHRNTYALVTASPSPTPDGTITGETNGRFSAFDAGTGETLWVHETAGNVGAPPISCTVNGRQFVAVATGPASGADAARSGSIRAFALP